MHVHMKDLDFLMNVFIVRLWGCYFIHLMVQLQHWVEIFDFKDWIWVMIWLEGVFEGKDWKHVWRLRNHYWPKKPRRVDIHGHRIAGMWLGWIGDMWFLWMSQTSICLVQMDGNIVGGVKSIFWTDICNILSTRGGEYYNLGMHGLGGSWQLWSTITSMSYEWTGWVWEITCQFQDYKKITGHFRGIYRICPNLMKENQRMSTCNRLDLQTLGSQPIMPKNLLDH
jgi:hypothetical protein